MPLSKEISKIGLSYRSKYYRELMDLEGKAKPQWLEIMVDNIISDSLAEKNLAELREFYPVVFHSVSLNLAGTDPIHFEKLQKIKKLYKTYEASWFSDHLCWTRLKSHYFHDLLPFPFTDELLQHIASRVEQVQEFMGVELVIENVSSYLEYKDSIYSEAEFLSKLCDKTGCKLLFDVNNLYVSSENHQFNSSKYLEKLPWKSIQQMHIAGHAKRDHALIDDHGSAPIDEVFELYKKSLKFRNDIPICLEWDKDLPSFSEINSVLDKIQVCQKLT